MHCGNKGVFTPVAFGWGGSNSLKEALQTVTVVSHALLQTWPYGGLADWPYLSGRSVRLPLAAFTIKLRWFLSLRLPSWEITLRARGDPIRELQHQGIVSLSSLRTFHFLRNTNVRLLLITIPRNLPPRGQNGCHLVGPICIIKCLLLRWAAHTCDALCESFRVFTFCEKNLHRTKFDRKPQLKQKHGVMKSSYWEPRDFPQKHRFPLILEYFSKTRNCAATETTFPNSSFNFD